LDLYLEFGQEIKQPETWRCEVKIKVEFEFNEKVPEDMMWRIFKDFVYEGNAHALTDFRFIKGEVKA